MNSPTAKPLPRPTPTIWTQYGTWDLKNPTPAAFQNLSEVARSLGNQRRFLGHTRRPYSVAEHLCHCHDVAPPRWRLLALCHDAHEAITADLPRPIKALFPEFERWERGWKEAAGIALGLDWTAEARRAIQLIDLSLCATELRDLMVRTPDEIRGAMGVDPLPLDLCYTPINASDWEFVWLGKLNRFFEPDESDPEADNPARKLEEDPEPNFRLAASRRIVAGLIRDSLERVPA